MQAAKSVVISSIGEGVGIYLPPAMPSGLYRAALQGELLPDQVMHPGRKTGVSLRLSSQRRYSLPWWLVERRMYYDIRIKSRRRTHPLPRLDQQSGPGKPG